LKIQLNYKKLVFERTISWATSSHQAFLLQVGQGLQKTYCLKYNLYARERPGNLGALPLICRYDGPHF